MKAEKYHQLSEVHLMQRIWRNELELAAQEVRFWEDLLGTLGEGLDPGVTGADTWQAEIDQLHHFQRLTKRLLDEIHTVDTEVADGVREGHVLDGETRLDHRYLRREMDSFHTDFRAFKTEIRKYMVAQPTF
ncbi:MAG: hypothetical protein H7Z72_02285 [Bacteroidetes bacterium]|nr:hypothetical protein [Fibrella sp.]